MPARCDLAIGMVMCLLLSIPAMALAAGMPDQNALDDARRRTTEALSQARSESQRPNVDHVMPSAGVLATQPVSAMPRIEPSRIPLDREELATRILQFQSLATPRRDVELLVFVSLSIPTVTLRLLAEQVDRAGGALFIRGLKGDSMQQTLSEVERVLDGQNVSWQIHPESFRRYNITQVPAFVLARPQPDCGASAQTCSQTAVDQDAFVKLAGDVSVEYALDTIGRNAPSWHSPVETMLASVRRRAQ